MTTQAITLTERDRRRTASPTIRGYVYQFDYSIIQILKAPQGKSVRIEGVEDVDILDSQKQTAVQVKYLEGSKYTSPKKLREPVLEMLRSLSTGRSWRYILHVHFGEGRPPECFTLDELKYCLTVERKDGNTDHLYRQFSDATLEDFCASFEIRYGQSFEAQQLMAICELSKALNCSSEDSEELYHALALSSIQSCAMSLEESERVLTRDEFIKRISIRNTVYARWNQEILGHEAYRRTTDRRLKRLGFGKPNKQRAVVVYVGTEGELREAVVLGKHLSDDYSRRSRLYTAKPWLFVLDGDVELCRRVKVALVESGVMINDGYESLSFSPNMLLTSPILNLVGKGNVIKTCSFSIRVVTADGLATARDHFPCSDIALIDSRCKTDLGLLSREDGLYVAGLSISNIQEALERVGS